MEDAEPMNIDSEASDGGSFDVDRGAFDVDRGAFVSMNIDSEASDVYTAVSEVSLDLGEVEADTVIEEDEVERVRSSAEMEAVNFHVRQSSLPSNSDSLHVRQSSLPAQMVTIDMDMSTSVI